LTPGGVDRESDADAEKAITRTPGRRSDLIIISILCAAVILFAYDKWWTGPPPERSVAVLPFVNMSSDDEADWLGSGVADTVLNMLVTIPDLHVASRTSSFQPRLQGLSIPEIAGLLGVATILEGSVQRQGDRLRITAQLVNADDDNHLWSKNFDREYGDVFAVQDEIAEAVASVMQIVLREDTRQPIDREGTDNLAAFEQYSRAIDNLRVRTFESVAQAAEQLQRAVELDQDYARAHAMLGHVYIDSRYGLSSELTDEERRERAHAAARTALRIAPGMSVALTVLGDLTEDVDAKGKLYREAVANGPSDTIALRAYTTYLFLKVYQTGEAIEAAEKLIRLDPFDEKHYWLLARNQIMLGKIPEALATIARGKEKIPDSVELRDLETLCYWAIGNRSSAIVTKHETLAIDPKDFLNRLVIATDYLVLGMPDEADRWFERATETAPEQERGHLRLIHRTLLDIYYQHNDEEVFESLRRWVTEPGHWSFPGFNAMATFIEYGEKLDRLEEVSSAAESRHRHLFADPPDIEKDLYDTFAVGLVLLRAGDRQRGEPFVRRGLEELDKRTGSGWGKDPAYVYALLTLRETATALDEFKAPGGPTKGAFGGFGWQFILRKSSVFDPIRDEPEFIALLDEHDKNAAEQRRLLQAMDLPVR
jgi:TolB-like protein/Flp pilus assembly protein TadD